MSLANLYEKLASADQADEATETEKIAAYYDQMGRDLFWTVVGQEKTAAKVPPGMFAGKKGIAKLLGLTGLGVGSYAVGKHSGRSEEQELEADMATRAYQAGVQRGAQAVLARIRQGQ